MVDSVIRVNKISFSNILRKVWICTKQKTKTKRFINEDLGQI